MKQITKWLSENMLFVITLFLIAFIPLYPKIPLLDIKNTWVYIRVEDFLIAGVSIIFFIQLLRRKATINTPLTIPIIAFWVVGAVSTLFAIFFIFPKLINVFPNLAILHYLRRIEYLLLFFVAFSAIRKKKFLPYVVAALTITLFLIIFYGFGQRFFGFPAFLTMNEEFAKGIPLRISSLARVPSTFAGHYDLAAYLVLLIPIVGSLVFGYKKIWIRLVLILAGVLGLILLLMTESRVSFGVYLLAISFMLILQKQKKFIIPVLIVSFVLLNVFQGLSERFGSTLSEAEVIYDARTGRAIGIATRGANNELIIEEKEMTGENLPQGSGFIGLPGGGQTSTDGQIVKRILKKTGDKATEITNIEGDFVVRKSLAYDISFTTRFQGTWPRALNAFKRNVLLGSGYSSISLASDGNYLRILGEVGVLGLSTFLLIFLTLGIYARKILPSIDDKPARGLIIGILAGVFGIGLNAIMIDVFEASKVAFSMWTLIGIAAGVLVLYQKQKIHLLTELKNVLLSVPAIILYLLFGAIGLYSMTTGNFFVGDDFTWLRWIADCKKVTFEGGFQTCASPLQVISGFFTDSQGFFYRPGTKVYFYFMYAIAWFSPFLYHVSSILLHFTATAFVFLIALHLLKNKFFAFLTALLFLTISGHFESVLWISSVGHLITGVATLGSVLFFIYWKQTKHIIFLLVSILAAFIAPYFHEAGIIAPFFVIAYDLVAGEKGIMKDLKGKWYYLLYLLPLPVFLFLKQISSSLWSAGDYSYNFVKFLPNAVGNMLGSISLTFIGTKSLPYIQLLRDFTRSNVVVLVVGLVIFFALIYLFYKYVYMRYEKADKKIIALSLLWFVIAALPFLGLGNIAPRYIYLSSFSIFLLLMFFAMKLYESIQSANKIVVKGAFLVVVSLFVLFHISELQRINSDWNFAGKITNNLLINMGNSFASTKVRLLPKNPVFYFANVPIRYGDAWVFPVGLSDALWFTFQNEPFTVRTTPTAEQAVTEAKGNKRARVFFFEKDGNVSQVVRPEDIMPTPTPTPTSTITPTPTGSGQVVSPTSTPAQ